MLIFVGGGGWQGTDHINSHAKVAATAVSAGFVAVILRHRPAGCARWFRPISAARQCLAAAAAATAAIRAAHCLTPRILSRQIVSYGRVARW